MAEGIKAWGNKTKNDGDDSGNDHEPIVSLMEIMEEQSHEEEQQHLRTVSVGGGGDEFSTSTGRLPAVAFSESHEEGKDDDRDQCARDYALALELSREPDCRVDEQLALRLQRQFDREQELDTKFAQSRQSTGRRQAVLAPDPYRYYCNTNNNKEDEKQQQKHGDNNNNSSDEEDGEEEDDDELREFATMLLYEKAAVSPEFPPSGTLRNSAGAVLMTKHDPSVALLKSTDKALQLPLALSTGDFIDSRIGGKVLNELRTFGRTETKRQMRAKDKEEKATSALSVDVKTRLTLLKWINSGEFDRVEEIIATGKESVVLHAILNNTNAAAGTSTVATTVPDEVAEEDEVGSSDEDEAALPAAAVQQHHQRQQPAAVRKKMVATIKKPAPPEATTTAQQQQETHFATKVYKTTLAGFRNRAEYVKDDFRFKNPRRVMKIWAEKEFMNLKRLKHANIMCPTPIKLRKHVLLMSMIGGAQPAPKLKELVWTDDAMIRDAFEQVQQLVVKMYKQCQLVHGDLSEFNLLYHLGTVYVIDLAQAMDISHPSSMCFLHRDIMNVLDFFGRIGCDPLPTPHALFQEVTDIEFDHDKNLFVQVESFERENRNMDLRGAKSAPANYELNLHRMDSSGRPDSPSRPYN